MLPFRRLITSNKMVFGNFNPLPNDSDDYTENSLVINEDDDESQLNESNASFLNDTNGTFLNDSTNSNVSLSLTNRKYGPKQTQRIKEEALAELSPSTTTNSNWVEDRDQNPNVKPKHSYCTLIILSLMSSPNNTMTLNEMYQFIMEKFAFYRQDF